MAVLTLRLVKGSPLTNAEVDNNFSNINNEVTVNTSNIGVMSQLTTTVKSNLVAAINEVKQTVSTDRISNTNSSVAINTANGSIVVTVNSTLAANIANTNGNANIVVNGNVTANVVRTTTLMDRTGNILVIKNESGTVIWGG